MLLPVCVIRLGQLNDIKTVRGVKSMISHPIIPHLTLHTLGRHTLFLSESLSLGSIIFHPSLLLKFYSLLEESISTSLVCR